MASSASRAITDPHSFDPLALAPSEGSRAARECGCNGESLSDIHMRSRLTELDQDLAQRFINSKSRLGALKTQIESAARRLAEPPFAGADEYSESKAERSGFFGRKKGPVTLGPDGEPDHGDALVPPPLRQRIDYYLQASAQNARQVPLHVIAMLVGVGVFLGALFVDYMIVSEFWTRALANEFLELPGTLADSVTFKSAQVLFAAIAAHLVFASLGKAGQKVFTRIVFLFAVLMLAGLGFLLATMSLPQGTAEVFGGSTSLDSALAELGLGGTAPAAPVETGPTLADDVMSRDLHTATWLGSLGVIFLVVTGVAAIALHAATNGLRHLVAVGDYRARRREAEALSRNEHEYAHLTEELKQMESPQAKKAILWAGLMREVQAHRDGLNEARAKLARPQTESRGTGGVFGRGKPQAVANTSNDDLQKRIDKCVAEMSIEHFEQAFEQWWRGQSVVARQRQVDDGTGPRALPGPA